MADYMQFSDLYTEVERALKVQGSGSIRDLVKMTINMVYLNEICVCDDLRPLFWLVDMVDNVKTKDTATITGASKASPCSITSTAHGFVSGDIVQIAGVAGMTELNNRLFVVVYSSANAFTLQELNGTAVNSTAYTTYTSGGYAYHRGTTLAKNMMSVESFAWHGYNGQNAPIGLTEIESLTSHLDEDTTSRPQRHLFKPFFDSSGNELPRLLWYPLPDDNYQARIWGPVRPSPMSTDASIPNLPFQFHRAIVAGAITRLAENQVQVENQVVWPGIYKMQLEAIKAFNRKWWNNQDRSDTRRGPYLA